MDPGVIVIVAIGTGGLIAIIRMGIRHEERKHQLGSVGDAAPKPVVDDLTHEVARLRDRVAVLEKLVTDDDRKLAGEIESLRRSPSRGAAGQEG